MEVNNIQCSECGKTLTYTGKFKGEDVFVVEEHFIHFTHKRVLCKECYKQLIK